MTRLIENYVHSILLKFWGLWGSWLKLEPFQPTFGKDRKVLCTNVKQMDAWFMEFDESHIAFTLGVNVGVTLVLCDSIVRPSMSIKDILSIVST